MPFQIRMPRSHTVRHAEPIEARGVQGMRHVVEAHLSALWPSGVMSTDKSFPEGVVTV